MTTYHVIALLAAEAADPSWLQESWDMIQSPAHWMSEAFIELGLGLIGLHAVQKLLHGAKAFLVRSAKKVVGRG